MSNIADNRKAEARGFARGIEAAAEVARAWRFKGQRRKEVQIADEIVAAIRALQDKEEPHG